MIFFKNGNADHNAREVVRKVIVVECALDHSKKIQLVLLGELPEIPNWSSLDQAECLQN